MQPFAPGEQVWFDADECAVCPLRSQCTRCERGRALTLSDDELEQQRYLRLVKSAAGREKLRERIPVEHRLAHLSQKQGDHARYLGERANLFDLRRTATVLNLEVIHHELAFPRCGGRRRGAGRKPNGARAGVSHLRRPQLRRSYPVLVTLKVRSELSSLRRSDCFAAIRDCLREAKERLGMRIVEFSVQDDHIHLILEAEETESLSRGMQGLTIRIAKRLNKALGRTGSVFADRFHAMYLKTPRQVRFALAYVLNNHRRHRLDDGDLRPDEVDPCSSAAWFGGWTCKPYRNRERLRERWSTRDRPTAEPRCWLLTRGWTRHGLVEPTERPARYDERTRRSLRKLAQNAPR